MGQYSVHISDSATIAVAKKGGYFTRNSPLHIRTFVNRCVILFRSALFLSCSGEPILTLVRTICLDAG